jgi:hypothetical protein
MNDVYATRWQHQSRKLFIALCVHLRLGSVNGRYNVKHKEIIFPYNDMDLIVDLICIYFLLPSFSARVYNDSCLLVRTRTFVRQTAPQWNNYKSHIYVIYATSRLGALLFLSFIIDHILERSRMVVRYVTRRFLKNRTWRYIREFILAKCPTRVVRAANHSNNILALRHMFVVTRVKSHTLVRCVGNVFHTFLHLSVIFENIQARNHTNVICAVRYFVIDLKFCII